MAPESVSAPSPDLMKAPAPEITLSKLRSSERLISRVPALLMAPAPTEPVVEPAPICNLPAVIVMAPLKVLAAAMVKVPAPSLVSVPVPSDRPVVFTVTLPAPPMVSPRLEDEMPPVRARVPASELMRLAEAKVIAPPSELSPERLRRAPLEEMPPPLSVTASEAIVMPSCRRSSAPEVTEVAPAEVPRDRAWAAVSTPWVTEVAPE